MSAPVSAPAIWDIFCQVIDNFGDIGVCWRVAHELAERGHTVRLRIDDASALQWMAPQGHPRVQVLPYDAPWVAEAPPSTVIEAFGCEAPAAYLHALSRHVAQQQTQGARITPLINLEYLSAERYVERCHRLPSLIMHGAGQGLTRWFFYPGFTRATGGLVHEQNLLTRQAQFDRQAWRAAQGLREDDCAISLFCYEPAALPAWLAQLQDRALPQAQLLVTPGRATAAVQAALAQCPAPDLPVQYLQPRSQIDFDHVLWGCDVNLVRGEDSLVRALWAGQPFVWHIYPQDDHAHHAKLDAFLDWMDAPASLRDFHHAWNGITAPTQLVRVGAQMLAQWRECALQIRQKLRGQNELITQLQQFAAEKS